MDLLNSLTKHIDAELLDATFELAEAKKALGVKPNLTEAHERFQKAGRAYADMLDVILNADANFEVKLPEPFIEKVDRFHQDLIKVMNEISICEAVIQSRTSLIAKNQTALN